MKIETRSEVVKVVEPAVITITLSKEEALGLTCIVGRVGGVRHFEVDELYTELLKFCGESEYYKFRQSKYVGNIDGV